MVAHPDTDRHTVSPMTRQGDQLVTKREIT